MDLSTATNGVARAGKAIEDAAWIDTGNTRTVVSNADQHCGCELFDRHVDGGARGREIESVIQQRQKTAVDAGRRNSGHAVLRGVRPDRDRTLRSEQRAASIDIEATARCTTGVRAIDSPVVGERSTSASARRSLTIPIRVAASWRSSITVGVDGLSASRPRWSS